MGKGDDAVLDAGATRIKQRDHGDAQLEGLIHEGHDFIALGFTQGAPGYGEVLGVHGHQLPIHLANSGHHRGTLETAPEVAPGKTPDLRETSFIAQQGDTLPCGLFTVGVLALRGAFLGLAGQVVLVLRETHPIHLLGAMIQGLPFVGGS